MSASRLENFGDDNEQVELERRVKEVREATRAAERARIQAEEDLLNGGGGDGDTTEHGPVPPPVRPHTPPVESPLAQTITDHPWSPQSKRNHAKFTADLCEELNVPNAKRARLIKQSTYTPHQLQIAEMVEREVPADFVSATRILASWSRSKDYKDYVTKGLQGNLLNPKIDSYINGSVPRFVRHVQNHPDDYQIPKDVRPLMTSKAFIRCISFSAGQFRSHLKSKLATARAKKSSIYVLVKKVLGVHASAFTLNDDIWARWAWISHGSATYADLCAKDPSLKPSKLWVWLDGQLSARRQAVRSLAPAERDQVLKTMFDSALQANLKEFPATATVEANAKLAASAAPTLWQQTTSAIVDEMHGYSADELVQLEEDEDEEELDLDLVE